MSDNMLEFRIKEVEPRRFKEGNLALDMKADSDDVSREPRIRTEFEKELLENFETQYNTLYKFALRYTRDPEKAEDLVQRTYAKALKHQDQYTLGTNIMAWLVTIEKNTFINDYRIEKRKRKKISMVPLDEEGENSEPLSEKIAAPETISYHRLSLEELYAVAEKEFRPEVFDALMKVPKCYRDSLLYCDIGGHKYKEIAEIQGIAFGTAMSRIKRGRVRLIENLKSHEKEIRGELTRYS